MTEPDGSISNRIPTEAYHLSEVLQEEMDARGWDRDELARRMGGDYGINRVGLDLYFEIGPEEPDLLIGDAKDLERAFGISAQFFLAIERLWREWKKARVRG